MGAWLTQFLSRCSHLVHLTQQILGPAPSIHP